MRINLVSFSVPYPPDYGGAIDVYYKLKALSEQGVEIVLHCFVYRDRTPAKELEPFCAKVYYYKRNLNPLYVFSRLPFIVRSRSSGELIDNLRENDYPILFEGLHTTFPVFAGTLPARRIFVRAHNVEHLYYNGLAEAEKGFIKRLFYKLESYKLKRYEPILNKVNAILAISPKDLEYFKGYHTAVELITPFHPFEHLKGRVGRGSYILIHADLSIPENIKSIIWLIDNVLSCIEHEVIIAGKLPQPKLFEKAKEFQNIRIIPSPKSNVMNELIQNAHINLIYSINPQGFKLKLLYSLFNGRFCLCNRAVVQNTGLEKLCVVADTANELIRQINWLMGLEFEEAKIVERKSLLNKFSNVSLAMQLIHLFKGR